MAAANTVETTTSLALARRGMYPAPRRCMLLGPLLFAAQTSVASFGSNPGALEMYEHVPTSLPASAPLVVVMHGCTQTASSMESAGWDTLADQYGFVVAYPQQQSSNNIESCFNWYDGATDDARNAGEAESIAQMVQYEITTHGVDPARVFVTGFSAGAAMTAVMAATYPDVFAAASIMSGLPYECATDETTAYSCMNPGVTKAADAWGALVRAAYTSSAYPRVQIWHGSSDTTVAPMNEQQLALQWTDALGTTMTATSQSMVGSAALTVYGNDAVETYLVSGMDHAVAIGTDGSIACPGSATLYFEDHGVCSTVRAAQFFGIVPGDGSGSGSGGNTGSGGGGGTGGGGDGGGGGSDAGGATSGGGGGCSAVGGSGWGAFAIAAIATLRALALRRRDKLPACDR
ncbi:MAG TPA: PHB depolymerase family esterase [Kofleriaceae bacterium]|nr:PHB depolymerase family esterase [Kofleriaceae bacterium]